MGATRKFGLASNVLHDQDGNPIAVLISGGVRRLAVDAFVSGFPASINVVVTDVVPGATVDTKDDIPLPAGVDTQLIFFADIPLGTRSMTLVNAGANPCRIRRNGEGGGATRGVYLAGNGGAVTFGGADGALDVIEGFSTLGTTISFIFQRT